jgi:pSer/pThr/pTyr-binding forkhead associated (FHA) protein
MARISDELPTLIAEEGPLQGQRWMLKDATVVGREGNCDIIIPDRQVSRYHARFTPSPEGMLLEDLSSKNGTHCNGVEVVEPLILQDGDIIQIALAQNFIFVSSDATLPLNTVSSRDTSTETEMFRLKLDKRSHRLWIMEKELDPPLSVAQFYLLELLYDRQGKVVPREELIEHVWSKEEAVGVSEQALDALIRRLRDRLASLDPNHNYIITIRGHGLRLDNPPT